MGILLFHMNVFKQNSIFRLCKDLEIDVRAVPDQDLGKTIGEISGMPLLSKPGTGAGKPVPFADEMMVLCGLEPDLLDRFLEEYRRREISPVGLKAVMTPFNAKWTPGRLCMELKKEQNSLG